LNFELLGYEYRNAVLNLGTVSVYIIVAILMIVFTYLAIGMFTCNTSCKQSAICGRFVSWLNRKFMFGFALRLITEGYLELSISSMINLNNLVLTNMGNKISSYLTLAIALVVLFYPATLTIFCLYNRERLGDPLFKSRYGSLYEGIDVSRPAAVMYYSAFTFRRLLFALTSVYLIDYAVFQIQVFCACSSIYSLYLVGVRPFSD